MSKRTTNTEDLGIINTGDIKDKIENILSSEATTKENAA